MGAIFGQTGRYSEALAANQKVVALSPYDAGAHYNLGITLKSLGKLSESESSFKLATTLKPEFVEAHNNLGITLKELGRLEEAEATCKRAIVLNADLTEAHYNLGVILTELGRLDDAEISFRRAIALEPDNVNAHTNLGVTLLELGKLSEAQKSCEQVIALKPDLAVAHNNLGNVFAKLDRLDDAMGSYRQAILLDPNFAAAYSNLGLILEDQGELEKAHAEYNKAITLQPKYPEAFNNSGNILQKLGRLEEAQAAYSKALMLNPTYAASHNNLGYTLQKMGSFEEAEASYREAITLKPDYLEAHSNLLFLSASMKFKAARYYDGLQNFSDMLEKQQVQAFTRWASDERHNCLRVGFVSGDFKAHPVGFFLEGVLKQLQKSSSIELYAYPTNTLSDEVTNRIRSLFHSWVPISAKNDREAAQLIHNDGIHILIDLSGHTAKNRLPVFGWKPAPIQITWLGYFGSTGLKEMDYILGDRFVTPKTEANHFTEKIWQLPESYLCFTPPDQSLTVSPLPAFSNGHITFGCFNSLSKMTNEVISVRSDILNAVPNSKLFLKDKQLDYRRGRDRVFSQFKANGISKDRLMLEGESSRQEYLKCYSRVDIALSPFPYGGGTTSVEGLWMRVPVIAKRGNYFLSHLGESIAHNAGLANWVASDNDDYILKAIEFSSNLEALKNLRLGLREKLRESPLYDVERFSSHLEQALFEMRGLIE